MLDTYGTRPMSWYSEQTSEDDEEEGEVMTKDEFIFHKLWPDRCWHQYAFSEVLSTVFPKEFVRQWMCVNCSHKTMYPDREKVNPDFTTDAGKVQLLREMMKQEGYDVFIIENGSISKHGRHLDCILVDLITDTTGKFRDACLEWLGGDE